MIVCTGFHLNFDWLQPPTPVQPNPRLWFKHCFPPGLGDKLGFVGYARPAQGGIPPCSELLARYIGLLLTGKRKLPVDYAERAGTWWMEVSRHRAPPSPPTTFPLHLRRAAREGECEKAIWYLTPNAHVLVDFSAFSRCVHSFWLNVV